MRKLHEAEVSGKKVLVRADFNVAVENGQAKESFKLEAARETVQYLLEQGAKVAVVSHLGRPDGQVKSEFSLGQLISDISVALGVKVRFVPDCVGMAVKEALEICPDDEVLLLENVRFYAGEEKNDPDFAEQLSANFEVFVNDAFSVCHRDQASVTGVAKILPSYAGLWLQREVENLERVVDDPQHPAIAIIGGAKIETKLPLIHKFEKNYDWILVGGRIANEVMDQKLNFSGKVVLPVDFAEERKDIGPKTIELFKSKILGAKTVIWNGPMGKFEERPFNLGTQAVLESILESEAYSLMGGGESVQMLEEQGVMEKISFVSTGGGAMLEYLSGNAMPGLQALE